MMHKPFSFLSTILAASLLAGSTVYAAPPAPIQHEHTAPAHADHQITKRTDAENMYNTIQFLSQAPRVAGSPEELKAVRYIEQQFKSYGYHVEVQPFQFEGYTAPSEVTLKIGTEKKEGEAFTYSPNSDVTAELVYVGLGTTADVAGKDLNGKIALIQRGNISFADKVRNAAKQGAKAVIIYNNTDGKLNGTLGGSDASFVAAVGITKQEGDALAANLRAGEKITATVKVAGAEVKTLTSHNVIATKKPDANKKNTNDIIIIGSHHDSVEKAPGANDDASGVAVTLELARVMSKLKTDTELRFITFGAEENGLIGSKKYAASLSEDEIKRTIGMFQLDMVGSKDAGDLIMYTIDGKKNRVTDLGAAASSRLSGVLPYGQEGRSDHESFHALGIPAALFIHAPVEPWYHTPNDTLDKISKEKLGNVADIVGSAVYQAARPGELVIEPIDYPRRNVELQN
ncbi:M28 family peptidase [Aneurinibacillus sp. XH2]|uniref:M28 family peptidase n=1 Tax=Aneurinibacillus sp. XH2 TaxID=1450761 RepID=UPI000AF948FD|nr:M28 family peptidase [Aneurinibacillus sp. XH2]